MSDYDNIYQTISSLTHRIMMDVQFKFLRPRIMDIFPQATIQRVEGGGNKASCDIMSSLCAEVSRLSRPSFFRFVQAIEMDHHDVAEEIRVKYKEVTGGITIPRLELKEAAPQRQAHRQAFVAEESGGPRYRTDGPTSAESSSGSRAVASPSRQTQPPQRNIEEQIPTASAYDPLPEQAVTQRCQMSKYEKKRNENRRLVYRMDDTPRGVCLIISNEMFEHENHGDREGSERDVDSLQELFQNRLGFNVFIERNKTAREMLEWLRDHARQDNLYGVSALAVAILTHGTEGDKFLGTDGESVTRVDLASIFNSDSCDALKGKPKLFIFQACRGTMKQGVLAGFELEESDAAVDSIAHNSDMCFVFASSPGYTAYRHPVTGSPFVTEFCQQVAAKAHTKDFYKIIREITAFFSREEIDKAMMLTEFATSLTKIWYLNPPNPPPNN